MQVDRCLFCMEKTAGYPCPSCGHSPQNMVTNEFAMLPGTIVHGRYLVGGVLGQGGFGITYTAWDLAAERKLALKEYFPSGCVTRTQSTGALLQWGSTEAARYMRYAGAESFLREARKMEKVSHIPEAVAVRDVFSENSTAYIAMDFVRGETLKARLERHGALSWVEALNIFMPVIEAMEQVHKAGIVHRDLSPDNIMLTAGGGVRILDLGAAKDLHQNTGASSALVAKNGFSPLEQYTERGSSGPWSDVYALAATIYYALTLKRPASSLDRVMGAEPDFALPPLQLLPPSSREALKKAMALRADDRTRSMEEFREELISCVSNAPAAGGTTTGNWTPGEYISFGSYSQGGGDQPVQWQILELYEDGTALLLSRYGLDTRPYHDSFGTASWGWSTLRGWLNGSFLRAAFTDEEQRYIREIDIEEENGDSSSRDRIFLLSAGQVRQYLNTPDSGRCIPTPYAVRGGAGKSLLFFLEGKHTCMYWLRTPGLGGRPACVNFDGTVYNHGMDAGSTKVCVRPAMRLDLRALSDIKKLP